MPIPIPPVNATLTRVWTVSDTGETNEYGDPIFGIVERWAGAAPAFTTEKHQNTPLPDGGTTLVYTATIAIPSDLAVIPGDLVTYTRNGAETTRVVDAVEDRADAGFVRCFVRDAG